MKKYREEIRLRIQCTLSSLLLWKLLELRMVGNADRNLGHSVPHLSQLPV